VSRAFPGAHALAVITGLAFACVPAGIALVGPDWFGGHRLLCAMFGSAYSVLLVVLLAMQTRELGDNRQLRVQEQAAGEQRARDITQLIGERDEERRRATEAQRRANQYEQWATNQLASAQAVAAGIEQELIAVDRELAGELTRVAELERAHGMARADAERAYRAVEAWLRHGGPARLGEGATDTLEVTARPDDDLP
jgi:uncharacterized membrane protein YccC